MRTTGLDELSPSHIKQDDSMHDAAYQFSTNMVNSFNITKYKQYVHSYHQMKMHLPF